MTSPGVPVVHRDALGDIAWQVLVRDGDVVPVTEHAGVPRGVRVGPAHRAAALTGQVEPGQVVVGRSAVWVHTGGRPPERTDTREGPHGDGVLHLAGVAVSDVPRTALDVASRYPSSLARPMIERLVARAHLDLDATWTALGARVGRPGVRRAERTLREMRGEPRAGATPAPRPRAGAGAPTAPGRRQTPTTGVSPPALAPVMRYTSNTPSTLRTAASTEVRCDGSAISKTKRDIATRSREVDTDADRMLT